MKVFLGALAPTAATVLGAAPQRDPLGCSGPDPPPTAHVRPGG